MSYNELYKLLIDRKINQNALTGIFGISVPAIAGFSCDESGGREVLERMNLQEVSL